MQISIIVAIVTAAASAFAIVEQMKSEAKIHAEKRYHAMDDLTKLLGKCTTPISDIERAGQPVIADAQLTPKSS